jgi:hypothetical protein
MSKRIALALPFILGLNPVARAEVTYLSCMGMVSQNQPRTLSIVIDTDQNTVAVDNHKSEPLGDSQKAVVSVPSPVLGAGAGTLNRITGQLRITIPSSAIGPGQMFEGVCKVTQKLF